MKILFWFSAFDSTWGYMCSCHEYFNDASGMLATPLYIMMLIVMSFFLKWSKKLSFFKSVLIPVIIQSYFDDAW